MRSTEDKIISAVLSWHDSNESDSPEDIGVMRHKIRAAIEADMAQPALVEVAKMVEIDDGLGTVFIEFYPGRRPKAGTKIFAQTVEPAATKE